MSEIIVHREVTVTNPYGLHARPAMEFVDVANRFACEIFVSKDGRRVNAKSILSVLTLAAENGTVLEMEAEGDQAAEALDALVEVLTQKA